MKLVKTILLSLAISVAISIVLVGFQISIESQQINKKVDRHFYNSNCLSAIGYNDYVLGCEGIANITRLNKINSKEFKVELYEFDFYKKDEGLSKNQVDYQIKNLQSNLLDEYLKDCNYKSEEANFVVVTARDIQGHDRLGVSLEDFNNYYDFKYFYIEIRENDWHRSESVTENDFIKTMIYKTNYYSFFKLSIEEFINNAIIITGICALIIIPILLLLWNIKNHKSQINNDVNNAKLIE